MKKYGIEMLKKATIIPFSPMKNVNKQEKAYKRFVKF